MNTNYGRFKVRIKKIIIIAARKIQTTQDYKNIFITNVNKI